MSMGLLAACASSGEAGASPSIEIEEKLAARPDGVDQNRIEHTFLEAIRARQLGDSETASQLFAKILREDPNNSASLYELARLQLEAGAVGESIPMAGKAARLEPENVYYQSFYGDLLAMSGQFERAAEVHEQIIALKPNDPEAYFQLAYSRQQAGQLDEALLAYNDIEQRFGADYSIAFEKHRILLVQGNWEAAARELEKVIELQPDDPQYYGMLARLYETAQQPEKALEVYERLLTQQGENPLMALQVAEILRVKGNYKEFEAKIREAFGEKEIDIEAKIAFLIPYIDSMRLDFSSKPLVFDLTDLLIESHPDDARSHGTSADFLKFDNRLEEARVRYLTCIEIEPGVYEFWRQVFNMDIQASSWDSLAAVTARCMNYFPNQSDVYYFNGFSLVQLGKGEEAVKSLERALPMTIGNNELRSNIYSLLGDAYHGMGNHEKSDDAYRNCLEIDPENAFVLNNFSYYLSLRDENLEEAEAMSALANKLQPDNSSFQDTYAWVLYKLARYGEARIWQEKAIASSAQGSATLHDHYGDILYQLGEIEAAVEQWKLAKQFGMESEVIDRKISERRVYD
jgi:tetratricopeptide (TPR) repeat protein